MTKHNQHIIQHPSKRLGQNFLINETITQNMIQLIKPGEFTHILEVGPGTGALTKHLINLKEKTICVEKDKRLAEYIKNTYKQVLVLCEDILNVDINKIFQDQDRVLIITNLPYAISSPFLFWFYKQRISKHLIVMLQKEFADRLLGKTKGALTLINEEYTDETKFITNVKKENFKPQPKVDSAVLTITKNNKEYDQNFVLFIKKCFAQKRKTLYNNLKPLIAKSTLQRIFMKFQISTTIRPEETNKDVLKKIYHEWTNNGMN